MQNKISIPRGTADILPDQIRLWQDIEAKSKEIFKIYNYKEIRTPVFEDSSLFKRSLGQSSDVVNKQLLELSSQRVSEQDPVELAGLALRPEGTASIVRSYIENSIEKKEGISKLYYLGPMFRGERPQKGRLRQFNQIGAEVIGPNTSSPYLDAEVIALSVNLIKSFGINNFELKINTLGSSEDKENFSKMLREKLSASKDKLCDDCKNRFERNVFRILDCKNKGCKQIVQSAGIDNSYLSESSLNYYSKVKEVLDSLDVAYTEDQSLVRGLDYYTHVVFEISCSKLGSQDAIGAGGRYNSLVSQLGGPEVDAIGFALGIERIILAKDEEKGRTDPLEFFVIALDEDSMKDAFDLLDILRKNSIPSDMNYKISSMKSQMRQANKSNARFVAIYGEEEKKKGVVCIKNMRSGEQQEVSIDKWDKELFAQLLGQK